jgi:GT2 family glycosyltransferase
LLLALEQDQQIGLVGPRIIGADKRLQQTCRRLPTVWNLTCELFALNHVFPWRAFAGRDMQPLGTEEQTQVEILSGCFWLARRGAIEKVGGLDERFFFYAEDVDWCKRFREAGWKVVFVAKASATHFGGASSGNAPLRYSIELLRANRNYWKKHHGLAGQAVFCALATVHHAARFLIRGTQMLLKKDLDPAGTAYKCRRSLVCLRWLLTGKGV